MKHDNLDSLGEQIAEDAAHIDAAHHRMLTKLRVFDTGGGWAKQGFRSCAQWLSWRVGWTPATAREHVRVANALGQLRKVDEALRTGQVSYSKVRAITRVATPENEDVLLEQAQLTTGHQLEQICRKYASVRAHEHDTRPSDDLDRRCVRRRETTGGMVMIQATLHPEEAAQVWAAIERIAAERCREKQPEEVDEDVERETPTNASAGAQIDNGVGGLASLTSRGQWQTPAFDRASALVSMAEAVLRGDRPQRSPTELVISLPVEALHEQPTHVENIGCCRDGTPISSVIARRLACDAGILAMVEDSRGSPLAVGRKQRTIAGALKRALLRRDQTCRFPGCRSRTFLEGHHMRHWADGGKTELSNLVSVCSFHHRFLHEYGFVVELAEDGAVTAYDPSGRTVPEVPPRMQLAGLGWPTIERRNAALDITAEKIATWDGTPADYVELVDALIRADAPQQVSVGNA